MKLGTITAAALSLVIVSSVAFGGLSTSKHNFTSAVASPDAYFTGVQQICVFCHIPHNADQAAGQLWNHESSSQSYQMYDSDTMDMLIGTEPGVPSKACLGCHDGTIAVNSLINVPTVGGAGTYGTPAGSHLDGQGKILSSTYAFVGLNLSDDHPVAVTYDQSRDNDFWPKTGVPTQTPDKLLYQQSTVECTSCHDPHSTDWPDFLVMDNSGSQLCLSCHTK
jgi:predicted CXXCH cytochrome family protein